MNEKKKIVVYGLGKRYRKMKEYIDSKFDIVGYSDTNRKKDIEEEEYNKFILAEDLPKYDYDYICITSKKYFQEIKSTIEQIIGENNKDKIISIQEAFGDFGNEEVRNKWVIEKLNS